MCASLMSGAGCTASHVCERVGLVARPLCVAIRMPCTVVLGTVTALCTAGTVNLHVPVVTATKFSFSGNSRSVLPQAHRPLLPGADTAVPAHQPSAAAAHRPCSCCSCCCLRPNRSSHPLSIKPNTTQYQAQPLSTQHSSVPSAHAGKGP